VPVPNPDIERTRVRVVYETDAQSLPEGSRLVEVETGHFVLT